MRKNSGIYVSYVLITICNKPETAKLNFKRVANLSKMTPEDPVSAQSDLRYKLA